MAAAANEVPVVSEDPGKKAQQLCFKFRGEKKERRISLAVKMSRRFNGWIKERERERKAMEKKEQVDGAITVIAQ